MRQRTHANKHGVMLVQEVIVRRAEQSTERFTACVMSRPVTVCLVAEDSGINVETTQQVVCDDGLEHINGTNERTNERRRRRLGARLLRSRRRFIPLMTPITADQAYHIVYCRGPD